MMFENALIVGGSGGIGAEIAKLLAEKCKKITIHGGHESKKFENLIVDCSKKCETQKIVFDFEKEDFAMLESTEIYKSAKKSDLLCVCFGPFVQKELHKTTVDEWRRVALFDYALPGILLSFALPNMISKKFGRILLFGGTATAHRSEFLTNAAYAGAKSALNVLVNSCASSYAHFGITCNAILPGPTLTEYNAQFNDEFCKKMPLKKQISVKTIAKSALFLIENPDINGAILRIDQGFSPVAQSLNSVLKTENF